MKILSWNVNGIRAVYKKGFLKWFKNSKADIICLQETKAQKEQIPDDLVNPKGYYSYFNSALKKGYSGVAVYTKKKPEKAEYKLGLKRLDKEGRILKLYFSKFTLINLYLPHGGRQKENLGYKLETYKYLLNYLKKDGNPAKKRGADKNVILIGDFNVAHQEIDLARPKNNQNNIMFTPEERKQIDNIIKLGFIDTFRKFNQKSGNYTWWPYFNNCRERNLGWRIDYCFISKKIKLENAFILKNIPNSDHCPIGINMR